MVLLFCWLERVDKMEVINAVIYTLLFSFATSVLVYAFVIRNKSKNLQDEIDQVEADNAILLIKLTETLQVLETKPVEQTDGFLQYMEATRDSAFEFIETMQRSIKQFENDTKSVFEKQRLSEDLKTIKKAYAVLKENTLPQDTPNN